MFLSMRAIRFDAHYRRMVGQPLAHKHKPCPTEIPLQVHVYSQYRRPDENNAHMSDYREDQYRTTYTCITIGQPSS